MAGSFIPTRDLNKVRYSTSQKIYTEDETLGRIQNIQEIFTNSQSNQINKNAVRIDGVSLTTASSDVSHKLGRVYSGFTLINSSNGAGVYEDSAENKYKDRIIKLKSSSPTIVSIMVF